MCGVIAASSNAVITKQSQQRTTSLQSHREWEMRLLYSKPMHKMLLIIERKVGRCADTSHDD